MKFELFIKCRFSSPSNNVCEADGKRRSMLRSRSAMSDLSTNNHRPDDLHKSQSSANVNQPITTQHSGQLTGPLSRMSRSDTSVLSSRRNLEAEEKNSPTTWYGAVSSAFDVHALFRCLHGRTANMYSISSLGDKMSVGCCPSHCMHDSVSQNSIEI